jgi:phage baseplate assembly protein W
MSFDLQILAGDLVIASNGDFATVSGSTKLEQDLVKIAMTPLGGNPLQPWYGSLVSKTLIGSYLSSSIIFTMAQSQLTSAVENLQTLQNMQVASGQQVTPDEQIASITNILINRNATDMRLISVTIQVLSKAFAQISTSFTVSNT